MPSGKSARLTPNELRIPAGCLRRRGAVACLSFAPRLSSKQLRLSPLPQVKLQRATVAFNTAQGSSFNKQHFPPIVLLSSSHTSSMACPHVGPSSTPLRLSLRLPGTANRPPFPDLSKPTPTDSVYREDCTQCFDSIVRTSFFPSFACIV